MVAVAYHHPFNGAGAVSLHPGVSVVIPAYNRPECLTLSLAALADQSLDRDDFEVLVVDDGSKGTAHLAIVQSFESRLDLRYIYQSDLGFRAATARNQGIALAKRTAVMLLDAGVILPPNVLDAVWQAHRTDPDTALIGTVHGLQPAPDNDPELEPIRASRHPGALVTDDLMFKYPDPRHAIYAAFDNDLPQFIAPWNHYWTVLTTAPTRALRAIGGFDETYTSWGIEDLECGYRLMTWGVHFGWHPDVRGFHFPHETSYPRDNRPNWQKFYAKHNAIAIEAKLSVPSVRLEQALRDLPQFGGESPVSVPATLHAWVLKHVLTPSTSWVLFGEYDFAWTKPVDDRGYIFSMTDRDYAPAGTRTGLGTQTGWPGAAVDVAFLGSWFAMLDVGIQWAILKEATRVSRNGVYTIIPKNGSKPVAFRGGWHARTVREDEGYQIVRVTPNGVDN